MHLCVTSVVDNSEPRVSEFILKLVRRNGKMKKVLSLPNNVDPALNLLPDLRNFFLSPT